MQQEEKGKTHRKVELDGALRVTGGGGGLQRIGGHSLGIQSKGAGPLHKIRK